MLLPPLPRWPGHHVPGVVVPVEATGVGSTTFVTRSVCQVARDQLLPGDVLLPGVTHLMHGSTCTLHETAIRMLSVSGSVAGEGNPRTSSAPRQVSTRLTLPS